MTACLAVVRRPGSSLWAAILAGAVAVGTLHAQCAPAWGLGSAVPGTNAPVRAMVNWDPDGAGPATPRVVIAGDFSVAGSAVASRIVAHDPISGTWAALGPGLNERVYALAALPNGLLVAGGAFTAVGATSASRVAVWNGSVWAQLGTGVAHTWGTPTVYALSALANGDLVAGGWFESAGGTPVANIARWNGFTWSPLGSGVGTTFSGVAALKTLPNGDLVAAGGFTTAGGVAANNIARWNGASWSALGLGTNAANTCLATMPNGDLVVGGVFASAGGVVANRLARWNGSAWAPLGTGIDATPRALAVTANGGLLVGGDFVNAGGAPAAHAAMWNGSAWSPLGAGTDGLVWAFAELPNGAWLAGGEFDRAGGGAVRNLARWNGTAWSAVVPGTDRVVRALLSLPDGRLVAGGAFRSIHGVPAERLAVRTNGIWSELGGGVDGPGAIVDALVRLPNGDLVVGGQFASAGGVPAACVARWNGGSWAPLGTGMSNPGNLAPRVMGLAVLPNGDLVAAGEFTHAGGAYVGHVARWDGTAWSSLGGGLDAMALSMVRTPDGSIVVAGRFLTAGGVPCNAIARWNGTSWSPLGGGLTNNTLIGIWVYALAAGANGDVYAGGTLIAAGGQAATHVARWDGTAWSPMGDGLGNFITDYVAGLFVLPNGDVLAGGYFRGSGLLNINHLARWNGTNWSSFGPEPDHAPLAFANLPDGDVFVGGAFTAIGSTVSSCTARLVATCPATANVSGPGCLGAQLTATALPWVGSTFRGEATGLPGNALAIGVFGLAPIALPLGQVLPQGVAGCTLLASPDLLDVLPVTAGQAASQLALPDSASLVGFGLHHQIVPLAFDPQGAIVAVTATNDLVLTIGSF
jgi:hypothetical protein